MTKSPSLVMLLLFVVSACATLTDEPVAPIASNPEIRVGSNEFENALSVTPVEVDPKASDDRKKTPSVEFNPKEIRWVQRALKTAGFDPGRIDGEFGPRTKVALLRLQAGCVGLGDLLQGGDLEKMAPSMTPLGTHGNRARGTTLENEQIRVIQVRLKDAGFDPGAVDGIAGPKTRAAVARFRSGCSSFKAMPAAVVGMAESTEEGALAARRWWGTP